MDFDGEKKTSIHTPHYFNWRILLCLYIQKNNNYTTFVHSPKLIKIVNYINVSFFNSKNNALNRILVLMEK